MQRVLGLDYGQKRIGVAVSNESNTAAFPVTTITYTTTADTIAAIHDLCADRNIGQVVIGLPLDQSGTKGPAAQQAEAFGSLLAETILLPVAYVDERFTSQVSQQSMRDHGMDSREQRQVIDQIAAQQILQTYIDQQHVSG